MIDLLSCLTTAPYLVTLQSKGTVLVCSAMNIVNPCVNQPHRLRRAHSPAPAHDMRCAASQLSDKANPQVTDTVHKPASTWPFGTMRHVHCRRLRLSLGLASVAMSLTGEEVTDFKEGCKIGAAVMGELRGKYAADIQAHAEACAAPHAAADGAMHAPGRRRAEGREGRRWPAPPASTVPIRSTKSRARSVTRGKCHAAFVFFEHSFED